MNTPEVKAKVAVMKGKKHSQETKDKMSQTHKIIGKNVDLKNIKVKKLNG